MNCIVAVDSRWAIGNRNRLLFSLPADMKRFRTLTSGGTVIMGRKTLDSFPGGKPLPKRRNIVITRNPDFSREGCEVVSSPEEAVDLAAGDEAVWVIGGASIYAALLDRCDRVFLTRVEETAERADSFFPDLDALPNWEIADRSDAICENDHTYRFIEYRKK